MTNAQHCNKRWKLCKKSKPEERKKTITLEKSTFTQRERKTKIQQNRKINENKTQRGSKKTIEQTRS